MFELLGYFHWCADGGILVKCSRDSLRQANATVGSSKGWYISLMHGVPASEEHGVRHLGAFIGADCRALVIGVTANRFVITAARSFQLTMRNQHRQVAKDSRGHLATDWQRQYNPSPFLD
jgi:hypothetical protein